jgi:hypothetical protein
MKHTVTHRFQRGQQLQLDDIYLISGLGDDVAGVGKWWEPNDEAGEDVTVTQDIEITVTIRTPNSLLDRNDPSNARLERNTK